jgi:two-component system, NarL family, invasion response regulator UvrY
VNGDDQTVGVVRVLVVDDQEPFRNAAKAVIARLANFEVVAEAASGEDAVRAVTEVHPDLVLMDINMGAMDGIEAARVIAGSGEPPMVVLLSTYALDDLPPTARSSGAAAYVNKDDLGVRLLRQLWAARGDPSFRA